MITKNSDLPAFACVAMANNEGYHQDGLSKREYFAGLAMQGLLARVPHRHNGETALGIIKSERIANESVIMADKLLKKLQEVSNDN
jgi:hypothetical protein